MSTIIPMVSSSPPPLDVAQDDDIGGFVTAQGRAQNDKFGDFAAFSEVMKETVNDATSSSHFRPITKESGALGPTDDWMDNEDFDDFAKFETARAERQSIHGLSYI